MKASRYFSDGTYVIEAQVAQGEPILSPDKTLKLIPCDTCLELHWKKLNVVSFLCPKCNEAHEA